MKKLMSVAMVALMMAGGSAFACGGCGCSAKKAAEKPACGSCPSEKKCDKAEKKCAKKACAESCQAACGKKTACAKKASE